MSKSIAMWTWNTGLKWVKVKMTTINNDHLL